MPFDQRYREQVSLLIRILPFIAAEPSFALKGGAAINLFVRNLPRLSVDIDLTYLPVQGRSESLAEIDAAMSRIGARIQEAIAGVHIAEARLVPEGKLTRLLVRVGSTPVKIEVTPVLRGCVYEPEVRTVTPAVEETFGFAEAQIVSFPDLYAGKIVAALDRQHPRDLFDIRDLLANEGIDDRLRNAFVVYLLSHDRPMAEVLAPARKEISAEFLRGFEGMTDAPVALDELLDARERLIAMIVGGMPEQHRRFLISFERGSPEWELLDVPTARDLPAVKWRQLNLDKLGAGERNALVARLSGALA